METKFTKGKWILDGIDVVSEDGEVICQVYDASDSHISEMDMDIVSANAKLIAAAPDLLEALEYLLNAYQETLISEYSHLGENNPEVINAKKAIKKATE